MLSMAGVEFAKFGSGALYYGRARVELSTTLAIPTLIVEMTIITMKQINERPLAIGGSGFCDLYEFSYQA